MKKIILICVTLFFSHLANSQVTDSTATRTDTIPAPSSTPAPLPESALSTKAKSGRPFNEKFALGFGTGFWITPGTTYIEIAPSLAYRFPKTLTTGIGFRYIYRHDRYVNNDLHSYGPNLFARANLTKRIYFWTEYEWLFNQYFDYKGFTDDYTRETEDTDSWFVGLGYVRSVGKKGRGGISMQLLYNVLYDKDDYSPYYSAYTYRIGYFF